MTNQNPAPVEPTDEQRSAVRWLRSWTAPNRHAPTQAYAQTLLAALPDALTNPQPPLPIEPGWYLDVDQDVLKLEDGRWYTGAGDEVDPTDAGPLTRLVPERSSIDG